jgi:glycosyltransferase involved in cell wall biosynthesis
MFPLRPQDTLKILFVTSHWPLAPAYGAQQRVLHLARLLSRLGDLSFVIVPSEPEDAETARRTHKEFKISRVVRPLISNRANGLIQSISERIQHELDPAFMATDSYEVSDIDRAALLELIEQHDLIWVHTIRVANWFRLFRWPHSILDVDDLPSRRLLSEVQSNRNSVKRLLDCRRYLLWRRREKALLKRFDILTACSEEDAKYLQSPKRVYVLPNGAMALPERPRLDSSQARIGFIGNCTFEPNEDGIRWFIREVWPIIKRDIPQAQLRLVGRGSENELSRIGVDTVGLGWLEDPGDEIASWSAMIVPIRFGSGTRVKMAEGFARKCPVVATTIGAFGYAVESGREFLLGDSAADFASACVLLLKDPELRQALAETAHKSFLSQWEWDSFESTVRAAVQGVLKSAGPLAG